MPTPRKYTDHAARQRAYLERQKAAQLAVLAAKNMPATAAIPTMPSTARWKALSEQAQTILRNTGWKITEMNAQSFGRKAIKDRSSVRQSTELLKPLKAR